MWFESATVCVFCSFFFINQVLSTSPWGILAVDAIYGFHKNFFRPFSVFLVMFFIYLYRKYLDSSTEPFRLLCLFLIRDCCICASYRSCSYYHLCVWLPITIGQGLDLQLNYNTIRTQIRKHTLKDICIHTNTHTHTHIHTLHLTGVFVSLEPGKGEASVIMFTPFLTQQASILLSYWSAPPSGVSVCVYVCACVCWVWQPMFLPIC